MNERTASELEAGRHAAGLSAQELWARYVALGGNATPTQVEAWLAGGPSIAARDHDRLAQALNDELIELGLEERVRYHSELEP